MKREQLKEKLLQTFVSKHGSNEDTVGIIKTTLDKFLYNHNS